MSLSILHPTWEIHGHRLLSAGFCNRSKHTETREFTKWQRSEKRSAFKRHCSSRTVEHSESSQQCEIRCPPLCGHQAWKISSPHHNKQTKNSSPGRLLCLHGVTSSSGRVMLAGREVTLLQPATVLPTPLPSPGPVYPGGAPSTVQRQGLSGVLHPNAFT